MNNKIIISSISKCLTKFEIEQIIKDLYIQNNSLNNICKVVSYIQNLYHEHGESPWTDKIYDWVTDILIENYNIDIEQNVIGSEVSHNEAVELPYFMGSMNKFKTHKLVLSWLSKYKSPYIISAKLDGISAMYINGKLYTRGNGFKGRDISFLIPFLKLGKKNNYGIRGELIMKKNIFSCKYSNQFSNARNLVCGIINRQYKNEYNELYKDIDFIAYDIYGMNQNFEHKFNWLKNNNYNCVSFYSRVNNLNIHFCNDYLKGWKDKDYLYEIDGIIISNHDNHLHKNIGNPDFAFAYKNNDITIELTIGIVSNVIWNISKDNYLKPTIQLQSPILCETSKIEFVTGFNAKFIKDNNIINGRKLKIGLSGNVIPHIFEVIMNDSEINEEDNMWFDNIDCSYIWSKNNVDLICTEKDNYKQIIKQNVLFFKNMNLKCNLQERTLLNLYNDLGIYHLKDIFCLSLEEWIKVDKMGKKKASTIMSALYNSLHWSHITSNVNDDFSYKDYFISLCVALQSFERGFAKRKILLHVDYLMNMDFDFSNFYDNNFILQKKDKIIDYIYKNNFKQITNDSMNLFLDGFINMNNKWSEINNQKNSNFTMVTMKELLTTIMKFNKPLNINSSSNIQVVFSGFRHNELMKKIENKGGKILNDVNKETTALIVNNKDNIKTKKFQNAIRLNVPIYHLDEFINVFKEFKDITL